MAALLIQLLVLLMTVVVESAVIVVGGDKGWTTGFDYAAWATAQDLQLRVGDSLGELALPHLRSLNVMKSCTSCIAIVATFAAAFSSYCTLHVFRPTVTYTVPYSYRFIPLGYHCIHSLCGLVELRFWEALD